MILIADDHYDTTSYLAKLLRQVGYNVGVYSRATDLLAQIGRRTPRLVILDVRMRGTDGVECLRRIRQSAEWRSVPVVVYSADCSYERIEQVVQEGAQAYVLKGTVPWSRFLSIIRKHAGVAKTETPTG
jgi:CheY-like chemotaxis protein